MKVEDDVGVLVLAGDSVRPQLLHEEDLVGELRYRAWKGGYTVVSWYG